MRRTLSRLMVMTAVALLPAAANAVPVTFEFSMPAFGIAGDFGGQPSVLTLTADNGSSTSINQNYLNTQITGMSVSVGSIFASLSLPTDIRSTSNALAYVKTDAFGIPTLDTTYDVSSFVVFRNAAQNIFIQLGTRDGGGPVEYAFTYLGRNGFNLDEQLIVGRNTSATSVPEPGTLALFGIALAGLGLTRRQLARR